MMSFALQSDEDLQLMTDAVKSAVDTYVTAKAVDWHTSIKFDDVVCQELESGTGRVTETAQSALTKAGTAAVASLPPQNSVCVTVLPVAGVITGRFYLPAMTVNSLDPAGTIAVSHRDGHATALQTLFQTLGARSSPARLGIWRSKTGSYVGSKGISIGNVYDTQRRRRNKLIESRITKLVL
jgi:hypothetical protein